MLAGTRQTVGQAEILAIVPMTATRSDLTVR